MSSTRRRGLALALAIPAAVLVAGADVSSCKEPSVGRVWSRSAPSTADPALVAAPETRFLTGGTATIGLDQAEIQALKLEADNSLKTFAGSYPARRDVRVEPFYVDVTEVTNEQWKAYLDATGRKPSPTLEREYWKGGKIPKDHEKRPIAFVSYGEAEQFARWALKRLPTEIEWEYAARGPDGRLYPWGDDFDDFDPTSRFDREGRRLTQEQIDENVRRFAGVRVLKGGQRANCGLSTGKRASAVVGTFPEGASPFGILDMAGNVWEWTSSPYSSYDPGDVTIEIRTSTGKRKYSATEFFNAEMIVVRGGAFNGNQPSLVAAVREGTPRDTWYDTIGFRCARSAVAGADLVAAAVGDIGGYLYRDAPLSRAPAFAVEHVVYDAKGLVRGSRHFVFAPSERLLNQGKAPATLMNLRKRTETQPQCIGVVSTSVPIATPPLPPGAYGVACLARNAGAAKEQKDGLFPKDGWYWEGMQSDPAGGTKDDAGARPADKDGKDKKAAKGAKAGKGGKAPSDEPPADPATAGNGDGSAGAAMPKAVTVDRSRDHVVLLDSRGRIVAALPLNELKESTPSTLASESSALQVERLLVKEDSVRRIPAHERVEFRFSLQLAGKKTLAFELPLGLATGALDPPPPFKTANEPTTSDQGSGARDSAPPRDH